MVENSRLKRSASTRQSRPTNNSCLGDDSLRSTHRFKPLKKLHIRMVQLKNFQETFLLRPLKQIHSPFHTFWLPHTFICSSLTQYCSKGFSERTIVAKQRVIRMLIVIVIIFFCCWTPNYMWWLLLTAQDSFKVVNFSSSAFLIQNINGLGTVVRLHQCKQFSRQLTPEDCSMKSTSATMHLHSICRLLIFGIRKLTRQ